MISEDDQFHHLEERIGPRKWGRPQHLPQGHTWTAVFKFLFLIQTSLHISKICLNFYMLCISLLWLMLNLQIPEPWLYLFPFQSLICFNVGSGSLSSLMREHRNFAQFYCISVTNFSTVSECILLEIIWIIRTFSSHSYGCFYVCMQCTSKDRQLIFYGRYLPFVRCRSRGPRHERKQLMCLSARWQSDTRCTQQYVVSLDWKLNADSSGVNAVVVYKHLWSRECILVRNRKTPSNV